MPDAPKPPAEIFQSTLLQAMPGEDLLARLRSVELVVVTGPDKGRSFRLQGERFTIGRRTPHDVVLSDEAVSWSHAELRPSGSGMALTDLGSTNGIWVGEAHITQATLADGAEFRVGDSLLRASFGTEATVAATSSPHFHGLVGASDAMRILFAKLTRLAGTPLSPMVLGETGTGKELIARALHTQSGRKGPFVVLDCASLPQHLAESTILGHRRGSFTNAIEDRKGCFEAADGGTLFLDEVGELSLELQPKLLRVLQEREVCRIGEVQARPFDVRIISATHRDLRNMVLNEVFREDLYQRLAKIEVLVPALRDRRGDIELLTDRFLQGVSAETEISYRLDDAVRERLKAHTWRDGNVRELRNTIERIAYMSPGPRIGMSDLVPGAQAGRAPADKPSEETAALLALPLKEAAERWVAPFQRNYCIAALARHGGNVDAAAKQAGYSRRGFVEMLRRLEVPRK